MYAGINPSGKDNETRESYPLLEINTDIIFYNAQILLRECRKSGIEPTAVIKGFNALSPITEAICKAGYQKIGSSRLPHLKQIREAGYPVETVALRIPMASEIPELVQYADISLESELDTLIAINQEAERQNKIHKVILMRDLGDLREGCINPETLYSIADYVEKKLPYLSLYGIGANLTCYGSVIPTTENLSELVQNAREVERRIGRRLETVSGGSTSSLPLLFRHKVPKGITDLRIGEALVVPCDLFGYWNTPVPGMSNRGLLLKAQIIEIGEKPTKPIGTQGVNGFGTELEYEDRGIRRRALLALGVFDIGDYEMLIPTDPGVEILGGSSDHLIADIHDSKKSYCLGDFIEFELHYKTMLFATACPMIRKIEVPHP